MTCSLFFSGRTSCCKNVGNGCTTARTRMWRWNKLCLNPGWCYVRKCWRTSPHGVLEICYYWTSSTYATVLNDGKFWQCHELFPFIESVSFNLVIHQCDILSVLGFVSNWSYCWLQTGYAEGSWISWRWEECYEFILSIKCCVTLQHVHSSGLYIFVDQVVLRWIFSQFFRFGCWQTRWYEK